MSSTVLEIPFPADKRDELATETEAEWLSKVGGQTDGGALNHTTRLRLRNLHPLIALELQLEDCLLNTRGLMRLHKILARVPSEIVLPREFASLWLEESWRMRIHGGLLPHSSRWVCAELAGVWWSRIARRTILIDKDAWATLMLNSRVALEDGLSAIPKIVGCRAPLFEQVLDQYAASAVASRDGASSSGYADAVTQALMGAIVATDATAATACLRHGAHPASRQPWAFGRSTTALHVAAEKHQVGVAAAMIAALAAREGRAPDLCVADDDGNMPLHRACELGDLRMAALLMSHGGDLLARNGEGERPHDLCSMFYRHKFEDFRASVPPAVRQCAWRRRSHLGVALARRAQKATRPGAPHESQAVDGTAAPAAPAATGMRS